MKNLDGWMTERMDGKDHRTDRHLKYYIYIDIKISTPLAMRTILTCSHKEDQSTVFACRRSAISYLAKSGYRQEKEVKKFGIHPIINCMLEWSILLTIQNLPQLLSLISIQARFNPEKIEKSLEQVVAMATIELECLSSSAHQQHPHCLTTWRSGLQQRVSWISSSWWGSSTVVRSSSLRGFNSTRGPPLTKGLISVSLFFCSLFLVFSLFQMVSVIVFLEAKGYPL